MGLLRDRRSPTVARTPIKAPQHRIDTILAHEGQGRSLLADKPLRHAIRQGCKGVEVEVRLTSYRSLPLSCIAGIKMAVDGVPVAADAITLIIDGSEYQLDQLGGLPHVFWFILDFGVVFLRGLKLAPGDHLVDATLSTVEPYMTAGRFQFQTSAQRRLPVEEF